MTSLRNVPFDSVIILSKVALFLINFMKEAAIFLFFLFNMYSSGY